MIDDESNLWEVVMTSKTSQLHSNWHRESILDCYEALQVDLNHVLYTFSLCSIQVFNYCRTFVFTFTGLAAAFPFNQDTLWATECKYSPKRSAF